MQISKEYIELLNSLTAINPSVLIAREEGVNKCRHLNINKDIFYELITPKETFDFDGTHIGFFQFPEFHKLFSAFEHTDVTQLDARKLKLIDVDTGDSFVYSTHAKEFIKGTFASIDIAEDHFKFVMTDKLRSNIKTRASLISAERIRIESVAGADAIRVTMLNMKTANEFAFDIKCNEEHTVGHVLDEDTGKRTDIDVVFPAGIITKLPNGDYDVSVSNQGLLSFILRAEGISLGIRAASVDEGN